MAIPIERSVLETQADEIIDNLGGPDDLVNALGSIGVALTAEDLAGVITSIAEKSLDTVSLPKKPSAAIRRARKSVTANLRGVREHRPHSPVLGSGQAAHRQLEQIMSLRLNPDREMEVAAKLEIDKGKVVGAFFGDTKRKASQISMWGQENAEKVSRHVTFSEPLDPPKDGEGADVWVARSIQEELNYLAEKNGGIPETPYEVRSMTSHEEGKSLLRLVQLGHLLFGDKGGLSLVRNDGVVLIQRNDELKVVNWLSTCRALVENLGERERKLPGLEGLAELPLGNVKFLLPNGENGDAVVDIGGGVCDWIEMSVKEQCSPQRMALANLDFKRIHQHIQGVFGSQASRHRERREVNGEYIESRTRLSRTLVSYISELIWIYGPEVVNHLNLSIDDFKLMGGDGTWSKGLNPEELPIASHLTQVSEYIFLAVAQILRASKVSAARISTETTSGLLGENKKKRIGFNSKESAVTVSEVIDYGISMGFWGRAGESSKIAGRVRYYLPQGTKNYSVWIPENRDELLQWGEEIIHRRVAALKEEMAQVLIYRAIAALTKGAEVSRLDILEDKNPLPSTLQNFAAEYFGKHYLIVEDLWREIESGRVKILRAQQPSSDVVSLWVEGITREGWVRVSVNLRSGSYVIGNMDGIMSKGSVVAHRRDSGLAQPAKVAVYGPEGYFQQIWNRLSEFGVDVGTSGEIIGPDGKTLKIVEGKPVICECDPMTGRWRISGDLLKEVLVNVPTMKNDAYGISGLAKLIKDGYSGDKQVLCPLPHHANTRRGSEHATLYKGHIFCHRDEIVIDLPGEFRAEVPEIKLTGRENLSDYRPVTSERRAAVRQVLKLARICESSIKVGERYLVERRGLNPKEDIGDFGYIPPQLSRALADLVIYKDGDGIRHNEWGWKVIKQHKLSNRSLAGLVEFLNQHQVTPETEEEKLDFLQKVETAAESLGFLPEQERQRVLEMLTLSKIDDLRRRGVVGKDSSGRARWGGRVHIPTYWPRLANGVWRLAPSNYMARAVELDGQLMAEGDKDYRMRISRRKDEVNQEGKVLRGAPAGFWVRDPIQFMLSAPERLIIFEGALNAASFGRILNQEGDKWARHSSVALCASGHGALLALVNWLQTKEIFIATDFDNAGKIAFDRLRERLMNLHPDINIYNAYDLLPENLNPNLVNWPEALTDVNDLLVHTEAGSRYRYLPTT